MELTTPAPPVSLGAKAKPEVIIPKQKTQLARKYTAANISDGESHSSGREFEQWILEKSPQGGNGSSGKAVASQSVKTKSRCNADEEKELDEEDSDEDEDEDEQQDKMDDEEAELSSTDDDGLEKMNPGKLEALMRNEVRVKRCYR